MPQRAFVAIDLGATSGRVMLCRLADSRLTLREAHRFPNQPVFYNGGLHWNMPGIWQEIRRGLDSIDTPVDSIGVDSWGVDYALLGEGGALLENPFHYRDARTDGVMEEVCARIGADRLYDITGVQLMPINTLYQLCAAQRRMPRVLAAAEHLVTIPDLVNFWLTGTIGCEYTIASTTQMLSQRTRDWAADLLRALELPTHLLTRIVPPGTRLGALSGAEVIAPACHDTASAVASVRASGDTAFLSSGTWSLLGTEVPAPVVTAAARDLNFTNEGGVCGTTRLLKNITGLWLLEGCRKQWTATWDELLAQAEAAPPLRSLIDPDNPAFVRPENMTAAICDYCRQTDQPAPADCGQFVRAVLESLALKYRCVLEQLETVTGSRFTAIRVIGGGAKNALLNQFTADATGRTVIAGPAEATALGNVAMQMLVLGEVATLDAARDFIEWSQTPAHFDPRPSPAWDKAYKSFIDVCRR
ncbi:MAG TPA: rhamnulokinase family protein [Bryobacteraceae bacterium]|nr:rhamnulokinase family protein [Bryobacteraceae bacterium]